VKRAKPPSGTRLNPLHRLSKGVVAYFPFWEGGGSLVRDIAGRSLVGTLTAGPTWSVGQFGPALSLDGVDDYVNVAPTTESVANLSVYSIAVRFRTTAASADDGRIYAEGRLSTNTPVVFLGYGFLTTEVRFFVRDDANVSVSLGSSRTGLNDGVWHQAVGIRNGTSFTVYVDGVPSGSTTATIGVTTIDTVVVGAHSRLTLASFFEGLIDNVCIYSRVLKADEVAELYADPFCMFESASKARWFVPSAPAAGLTTRRLLLGVGV